MGQHTVTLLAAAADGSAVSRVAYLTVNASGRVMYLSFMDAEPELAETGFDGAPVGGAALLLVLDGGVLVRRRRRKAVSGGWRRRYWSLTSSTSEGGARPTG